MAKAFGFVSKVLIGLFSLLKIALATAIIIIVATELYTVTVYDWPHFNVVHVECLMAGESKSNGDVCEYTYAVCGLSILLTMVTSVLLCMTCDACGIGTWIEFIIEGFQTAWWVIASIVITSKVRETNDVRLENGARIPEKNYRNAVAVMAWVAALLSGLTAIVCLIEAIDNLFFCCAWFCYKRAAEAKAKAVVKDVQNSVSEAVTNAVTAPTVIGNDEAVRANAV